MLKNRGGTNPPASLNRRRGTGSAPTTTIGVVGGVGGSNGTSILRSPIALLAMIALAFASGMLTIFLFYIEAPPITNSHIVQPLPGNPNLLRGKEFAELHHHPKDVASAKLRAEFEANQKAAQVAKAANEENQQQQQQQRQAAEGGAAITTSDLDLNMYDTPPTKEYPYPLIPTPATYDISKEYTVLGGKRYSEYTTGGTPYLITPAIEEKSNEVARSRRIYVKKTMSFAWEMYKKYAFGMDEIQPATGRGSNGWGGQGITLVDSLDTLWLMDMKDEFWEARDWVRDHLDHSTTGAVSVFETTIRDLGGLLSAYDWSGDKAFLDKAIDLGERLLHSFDCSTIGIPCSQVSLKDGRSNNIGWTGGNAILAEFGTIQLEFKYLSKAARRPDLQVKTDQVFEIMNKVAPENGLYPYYYRNVVRNGDLPEAGNNKLTFGAMADSFYEYMLKLWLQTDKQNPMYRDMYDKAIEGMHKELLQKSTPSGLTYIADKNNGRLDHKMDHLVCFMGGLLALGAYTDPLGLESERAQRDLRTGKALTYTCYQMYARMNTGISAEFVQFSDGQDFQIGRGAPHYLLRPEAVESMFILNYLTKDPVYREWGWEVFQSIEKYCKTTYGYGSLNNVQDTNGTPRDKMESFFLAETLKYLYLLQDPDTEVDILNTHVFNTEAHPVRIISKMS